MNIIHMRRYVKIIRGVKGSNTKVNYIDTINNWKINKMIEICIRYYVVKLD